MRKTEDIRYISISVSVISDRVTTSSLGIYNIVTKAEKIHDKHHVIRFSRLGTFI